MNIITLLTLSTIIIIIIIINFIIIIIIIIVIIVINIVCILYHYGIHVCIIMIIMQEILVPFNRWQQVTLDFNGSSKDHR